ncbi:MAG: hypothetical protein FJ309_14650 [Planctomycetes bacterium]|nr:hypothetical protein [Planctomycetota bacterium]
MPADQPDPVPSPSVADEAVVASATAAVTFAAAAPEPAGAAASAGAAPTIAGDGVVHEIRWSDALPWWLLFRAAAAAFSPTVILLAAAGSLALWAGWSVADKVGLPAAGGALPSPSATATTAVRPFDGAALLAAAVNVLPPPAAQAVGQALALFSPSVTAATACGALVRLGWFVVVWSLFGTAIARVVGLRLAREEPLGFAGAVREGMRLWTAPTNAALFTLLAMLGLSLPGMLLGFLMRTEWGLAAVGVIWPLFLAAGLVLALLAVGVVVGWPLMVAATGIERGDSFQAISTSFSYLYQRPLHAAFYAFLAAIVAVPALTVAALFADATAGMALWGASFGMGHERTTAVLGAGLCEQAPFGARAIRTWTDALESILGAFGWGYFWSIATAAVLLLRRDVDGTEIDEINAETTDLG